MIWLPTAVDCPQLRMKPMPFPGRFLASEWSLAGWGMAANAMVVFDLKRVSGDLFLPVRDAYRERVICTDEVFNHNERLRR